MLRGIIYLPDLFIFDKYFIKGKSMNNDRFDSHTLERIDKLEMSFERVLESVNKAAEAIMGMSNVLMQITSHHVSLDDKANSIIRTLEVVNTRLDNFTDKLSSVEDKLSIIEAGQGSTEFRIKAVEDRLGSMEDKFEKLSQKINNAMSNTLERIDKLEEFVSHIQDYMNDNFDEYESFAVA